MKWLGIFTGCVGLFPFIPFLFARAMNHIPAQENWDMPHGPWNGELIQLAIVLPALILLVLPIVTISLGIRSTIMTRKMWGIYFALLLIMVQIGFEFFQLTYVYWLVD